MAVDRDVLAYVCYTPEQRTSVCRPELARNVPLGGSRLLDRSRRFTRWWTRCAPQPYSYKVPKAVASAPKTMNIAVSNGRSHCPALLVSLSIANRLRAMYS